MSLLGVEAVLRLARDAWSMFKRLRESTNEYPLPPKTPNSNTPTPNQTNSLPPPTNAPFAQPPPPRALPPPVLLSPRLLHLSCSARFRYAWSWTPTRPTRPGSTSPSSGEGCLLSPCRHAVFHRGAAEACCGRVRRGFFKAPRA